MRDREVERELMRDREGDSKEDSERKIVSK